MGMGGLRVTRVLASFVLFVALVLSGCAAKTSSTPPNPPAPTPPQIQIANDVNALAQALDAAITGLRAARDQGKLNATDVLNAEKVAGQIAATGKQINAELRTADTWGVQKAAIVAILKNAS